MAGVDWLLFTIHRVERSGSRLTVSLEAGETAMFREAAEELLEEILSRHEDRVRAVLADIVEACLRRLLSSTSSRERLARRLLKDLAGSGLLSVKCEGGVCTAVIDVDAVPDPEMWEDVDDEATFSELLDEEWPELEVREELVDRLAECLLEALGRVAG